MFLSLILITSNMILLGAVTTRPVLCSNKRGVYDWRSSAAQIKLEPKRKAEYDLIQWSEKPAHATPTSPVAKPKHSLS